MDATKKGVKDLKKTVSRHGEKKEQPLVKEDAEPENYDSEVG